MIRKAKFGDIPRIVELLCEAHERSIYADTATMDTAEAKRLVMQCIQRHGHKTEGGCVVFVAETQGAVQGFIIGTLTRHYHICRELAASDLFFYATPDSDPRAAPRLLDAMIEWAETNPKVIAITQGVTDVIDSECRASALYERRGFRRSGLMFERIVPCLVS